ncbi:hypothetical protein HF086_001927 [Spodoptera exigua]|uniref:CCHC-type domain-containing protein n=1 Tax=Spodoptera exigua TaxID=7107 RepID=A0A922MEV2_SPOEX|nr:hypothetical protein HF086_001927 [Spodoptera exigua]
MPIGHIEPFNVTNNNWEAYVRRVNQFITLNSIGETLKVATLVTVVGAECYDLMCDLCAPNTPESKTYDQLVSLVKEHLEPDRSEIAERHIFRQRVQRQGENIREYLQALKHLAKTCNFGACLDVCLRDQFVSGLFDEDMRSRIFAEKSIDYKRAVELALALEAAERHAATACASASMAAAQPTAAAQHEDDGLHRISAGADTSRGGRAGGRRGTGGGGAGAGEGAGSGRAQAQRACSRCGKLGHSEGKCRFKQYSCDVCGEKGHLKAVCTKCDKYGTRQ